MLPLENAESWDPIIERIITAPEFRQAFEELGVDGGLGPISTIEDVGKMLLTSAHHREAIAKDAEAIEEIYANLDSEKYAMDPLTEARLDLLKILHTLAAMYFVMGAANGFHSKIIRDLEFQSKKSGRPEKRTQ